jgi:predicted dinucleotide-binding enzyme
LPGADAVILALRFTVLKGVIDEIGGALADKLVVVPSNPLTIDAHGNVIRVLSEGQSSGKVGSRAGGDLHDLVVGPAEARSLIGRA